MCFCQEGRVGEFCESSTYSSSFSEIILLRFDLISVILVWLHLIGWGMSEALHAISKQK